ncbi:TonB-dependent receptor plug domain-containing protein [Thermomonas sp. S9]|uniref:TonB-dependent receptor plug domain-containing protein n=1 Tax=Thermomonas sp. S9 TaxID=2885203 RepID=UPI00216B5579|nr:TonB-dependent receptor plug domain-containing protein [Thermomonas sp. S9]MCR6495822.1 TonB-dependent receptor plug domain-containing protein [Thermomonas sp. S9]
MKKHAQVAQLRKLPLFLAVLGCLYGAPVLAQEAGDQKQDSAAKQEDAKKKDEPKELEKVTVTGSLIKRLEYDTISPVQVISADVSVDVGQINTAEFLQKSSVAAGSTQISNQFAGFVVEGGTGVQTINLRGLGAQRTAVLLNGQRPGPAGTRGQVLAFDLNVIPQSILQRAEIVKDGSSSIYGSDALAGVVNLITRKNFNGPEVTFTARSPQKGGRKRSASPSPMAGTSARAASRPQPSITCRSRCASATATSCAAHRIWCGTRTAIASTARIARSSPAPRSAAAPAAISTSTPSSMRSTVGATSRRQMA